VTRTLEGLYSTGYNLPMRAQVLLHPLDTID